MATNNLSATVKALRKRFYMTQEELALKSGVGLRFIRELEQGKPTLRLDKVNQVLDLFNFVMEPVPKK
ncbi:MAG: helix-turn-helix transcriptional regulator, partial [Candidatus Gastranaerophilaceae bacterium]|nr:helix-turn-helix transcriptional regulator [Candidatus Gastranaerophilaceae bacterium]